MTLTEMVEYTVVLKIFTMYLAAGSIKDKHVSLLAKVRISAMNINVLYKNIFGDKYAVDICLSLSSS